MHNNPNTRPGSSLNHIVTGGGGWWCRLGADHVFVRHLDHKAAGYQNLYRNTSRHQKQACKGPLRRFFEILHKKGQNLIGFSNYMVRKMDPVRLRVNKMYTGTHLDTRNKHVKAFWNFAELNFPGEVKGQNFIQNRRFPYYEVCKIDPVRLRVTKIYTSTYI